MQRLCQLAGVEPAIEPDRLIALRSYVTLAEQAAQSLREPEFGWSVGMQSDLRNLGPVGQSVLQAPTLGAGLSLFAEAFTLVQSDTIFSFAIDGDRAQISYRILDPDIWPRQQDAELSMGLFTNLIRVAAGTIHLPIDLRFEHQPSQADGARLPGLPFPAAYGAATNSVSFPIRLLDLPLPDAAGSGFGTLRKALADVAAERVAQTPLVRRVRQEIFARLIDGRLDQTSIAHGLGLSERSLRRHLDAAGTSFSDILADCRLRWAKRWLQHGTISLATIAERLAYSDQTAFERAFRHQTGQTPAQFRRENAV